MAGHSKWANIKHRKARQDSKRSRIWSKCSRAIIVAAKNGGGDPDMNLTLRYAIEEAKAQNMPKDTIEKAIKKGSGDLEGVHYEEVIYEGYGPCGVAVMLEVLTDNRNRIAPELRKIFEKAGGNLGSTGSVAFNFVRKGEIILESGDEEQVMETALEAGAEDIEGDAENGWQVLCEPSDFIAVKEALEAANLPVAAAQVSMIAINHAEISADDHEKIERLVDTLEDNDDVQKVHTNASVSD